MYPSEYDDSLKPIYLFEPHDAKNHLVFIRNLNSFFKANVKVCFPCKKVFLTHDYRHLCPKAKCCFSCRRFFQSTSTFVHEKLIQYFCDKNLTKESSSVCPRCNVTCYSKHCYEGHKYFCSGKGTFGYKCLKCNKFTYRRGMSCAESLKLLHKCGEDTECKFCREKKDLKDPNHLCKLKKETVVKSGSRIAFITMEHFETSITKCKNCEVKNLVCEKHHISTPSDQYENEPLLIMIYREESCRGNFTKYEITNFKTKPTIDKTENVLSVPYEYNSFDKDKKHSKITEDFKSNYAKLQASQSLLISTTLLQLITSSEWHNTTFICQDENSLIYVRYII